MATRITFLGTAGEHAVVYKHERSAGGILLETEEQFLLLDPGPGTLVQGGKIRFNFRENTAVFLSSQRVEQCSDANAIIDAMSVGGLDRRGVLLADLREGKESPILEKYRQYVERIVNLEPGKRIGIENIEMTIHPTVESTSLGVMFFTKDGIVAYPGNTSYTEEIGNAYKSADVLILNVFNPRGVETRGYMNTENAIQIVALVRPKVVLITHFGLKMIKAEPLYEAREIQRITGIQTIAAKEGLSLALTPYASSPIIK